MPATSVHSDRHRKIRALFDEYIELYASRDDRLTTLFSDNFSGYTGGGDFLVKNRDEWVKITRQDFAQVPGRLGIEMLDISLQDLSDEIVVVTAFFHIHLPIPDHILAREVARLLLIYRLEGESWKIVHSGISIPYHLVQDGEVYPLRNLQERNLALEALVEERTKALNESEALYRQLTEDATDVLWKTDEKLCVTYISPSDERLRGYRADEVIGHHVFELFTDEGIAVAKEAMAKRQAAELHGTRLGFLTFDAPHRCKDGRVLWGEVFSKPERDKCGTITGYHGITREITERKQIQDQVRQLAFYDPLTNLPNRSMLKDRLTQTIAASKRTGCLSAVMFVDLDNFKPLNDLHGHFVGDLLLIEVANRLRSCVREADTVARFGGDEFVVVLSELNIDRAKSTAQAALVAENVRKRLSGTYRLNVKRDGHADTTLEHHCSASIGVVVFMSHEASQDDILKWADQAMYQAKEAGRNTIRFHDAAAQT